MAASSPKELRPAVNGPDHDAAMSGRLVLSEWSDMPGPSERARAVRRRPARFASPSACGEVSLILGILSTQLLLLPASAGLGAIMAGLGFTLGVIGFTQAWRSTQSAFCPLAGLTTNLLILLLSSWPFWFKG
jgi:hypothetical protein